MLTVAVRPRRPNTRQDSATFDPAAVEMMVDRNRGNDSRLEVSVFVRTGPQEQSGAATPQLEHLVLDQEADALASTIGGMVEVRLSSAGLEAVRVDPRSRGILPLGYLKLAAIEDATGSADSAVVRLTSGRDVVLGSPVPAEIKSLYGL